MHQKVTHAALHSDPFHAPQVKVRGRYIFWDLSLDLTPLGTSVTFWCVKHLLKLSFHVPFLSCILELAQYLAVYVAMLRSTWPQWPVAWLCQE